MIRELLKAAFAPRFPVRAGRVGFVDDLSTGFFPGSDPVWYANQDTPGARASLPAVGSPDASLGGGGGAQCTDPFS